MATVTLEQAQAQLDKYLQMSLDYDCQSYTSTRGGQKNAKEMPSLTEINKQINYWTREVSRLSGTRRVNAGCPM
ncbi:hypothetical protein [uncultured Desulfuromusa sp.]|uniref:hypothetical protein n=1 Tax=uncultured Desulfuromusa sp. TaxID=219183 RepID=UPI002AA89096|nr:hypothetical protein [uncultured Desulfuromusa sp.]